MTLVGTDYTLAIEVAGMGDRQSTNTIKVPMSSLSRTMQFIHRQGGKVINVTRLGNAAEVVAPVAAPSASTQAVSNSEAAPAKDNRNDKDKNDKRGGKSKKR
jgi:hypothetical protein